MRSRVMMNAGVLALASALLATGQTVQPRMQGGLPPRKVKREAYSGSHTANGTAFDRGHNARKRSIPKQRKHRVRLRAHLDGRLRGRPLTAYERSYL